jgi:glycosyltransferase involved in cell wall biosynthesis
MKPIDIFILCYRRPEYTLKTLQYLFERTTYPFRLFMLIQENDDVTNNILNQYFKDKIFLKVNFSRNIGISPAWNIAAALAESEYFITSDNDIYVPDLRGVHLDPFWGRSEAQSYIVATGKDDWLNRLVTMISERPDYGAISLHPHVFIGAAGIDPQEPEDVVERNMCGGVMRIMRKDAVLKAGGWERDFKTGRGSEERTICSRLQTQAYKVGVTSRIRAYHPFGKDIEGNMGWGYNDLTPEQQGHTPALKDEVLRFDNMDAYNDKTWLPK